MTQSFQTYNENVQKLYSIFVVLLCCVFLIEFTMKDSEQITKWDMQHWEDTKIELWFTRTGC